MRSSTLIVSYLWKDTWSRWWEQPSSVLARLFVGVLLALVATAILVLFALTERSIRDRLESFGLNTLVVRETFTPFALESSHPSVVENRFAPLAHSGLRVHLRQLYPRAHADLEKNVLTYAYTEEALPILRPWLAPDTSVYLFTDKIAADIRLQVTIGRRRALAAVRPLNEFFRPLASESLLLIPAGWAPDAERSGFIDTLYFQRQDPALSIERYVDAVQLLYTVENRQPPQIQSAIPMIKELETLQARQQTWRIALAAILGLVISLVYGSIALLEFRQNLFISALLRSLGAPARFLYARQWIENAFLANLAALAAIALLALFHTQLFGTLGFSRTTLAVNPAELYWNRETALILLCVNLGAFLSSIPVAFGLRRPIGRVLN